MFIDMVEGEPRRVGRNVHRLDKHARPIGKRSRRAVVIGWKMKNPGTGLTIPREFKDDVLTGDTRS